MNKIWYLFLFLIATNIYSTDFNVGPRPARYANGGTVFFFQTNPGNYNIALTVYDAIANVVFSSQSDNYVISDASTSYPFESWNFRNRSGMVVANGTYLARIRAVNTATGNVYTEDEEVAVANTDYFPPNIIQGSNGDKIIVSKFASSTKAIILLEGCDAMGEYFGRGLEGKYRLIGNIPGYDFFVVDWYDAGVSIYTNAQNALSIVQQLKNTYNYSEMVLIGKSMGGVVGRLMLAKAEKDKIALPVKKFISLDSPQQGGQVNLTAQASIYRIISVIPDFLVPLTGAATAIAYRNNFLLRPSCKEMLYYHVALVENQIQSGSNPLNPANLDAIRFQASQWHNDFYNSLKNYGNIYGYPNSCKNYAVSYSNGNLLYTGKAPNQYMADFSSLDYHIYSDKEDINQGSYTYKPQIASELDMKNGYSNLTVFIPVESALDLKYIDFAKTNGVLNRSLTYDEMSRQSPFDKIYVKSNRVDHMTAIDGELLSFITDAINDNTPNLNRIVPQDFVPILTDLIINN